MISLFQNSDFRVFAKCVFIQTIHRWTLAFQKYFVMMLIADDRHGKNSADHEQFHVENFFVAPLSLLSYGVRTDFLKEMIKFQELRTLEQFYMS